MPRRGRLFGPFVGDSLLWENARHVAQSGITKEGGKMSNGDSSGGPKKWWQRLLMYPTLITAILGSIPTAQRLYQSWQIQVPTNEVDHAMAQDELWRRNLDCLSGRTYDPVTTPDKVRIGALVCPSGDV